MVIEFNPLGKFMTEEVKNDEVIATEVETTETTEVTETEEETVAAAPATEESEEEVDENQDPDLAKGDSPEFQWYVVQKHLLHKPNLH